MYRHPPPLPKVRTTPSLKRQRGHVDLRRMLGPTCADATPATSVDFPTTYLQMTKRPRTTDWLTERPAEPRCNPEFWIPDVKGPAALSLVYAWILQNTDWLATWVQPYKTLKWDKCEDRLVSIAVGGHYRRRAHMGKVPQNLALTCKFDRKLVRCLLLEVPYCAARERWGRDGKLIPREHRQLAWN